MGTTINYKLLWAVWEEVVVLDSSMGQVSAPANHKKSSEIPPELRQELQRGRPKPPSGKKQYHIKQVRREPVAVFEVAKAPAT